MAEHKVYIIHSGYALVRVQQGYSNKLLARQKNSSNIIWFQFQDFEKTFNVKIKFYYQTKKAGSARAMMV